MKEGWKILSIVDIQNAIFALISRTYLLEGSVIIRYLRVLPIQPRPRPRGICRRALLLLVWRRRVSLRWGVRIRRLRIPLLRRRVRWRRVALVARRLVPWLLPRIAPVLERWPAARFRRVLPSHQINSKIQESNPSKFIPFSLFSIERASNWRRISESKERNVRDFDF